MTHPKAIETPSEFQDEIVYISVVDVSIQRAMPCRVTQLCAYGAQKLVLISWCLMVVMGVIIVVICHRVRLFAVVLCLCFVYLPD